MNKIKTQLVGVVVLSVGLLAATALSVAGEPVEIVALGDSLTAGLGVGPGDSFPEQLEAAIRERGHDVRVANAGVSGDTASDGLARLEWSVPAEADIVIVELGANDALRGLDPSVTRAALEGLLAKLAERGQTTLLAGMQAPRNLGEEFTVEFDAIFPELAAQYDVAFYPFFLEGVAIDPTLNQADGIHPNAAGVARIVEGMVPLVEELVIEASGDS